MRRSLLVAFVTAAGCLLGLACGGYGESDVEPPPADGGGTGDTSIGPNDAGAETGDAGAPTFCSSKKNVAWCEDFDSITDVAVLAPESSAGATPATLTQKNFFSAPRSLHFGIGVDGPAPEYPVVAKSFATDKDVRAEIDWRWAAAAPSEGQTLQSLTVKKGNPQASFGRTCGTEDAGVIACKWFVATCVPGRAPECRLFAIPDLAALSKWSHIALEVHFAATGRVRMEEDGQTIVDVEDDLELTPTNEPTSVTLGVAVLQGKASGLEIFFDNAFVELR